MSVGRPKMALEALGGNWREKVRQMGEEGESVSSMRAELGLSGSVWRRFMKDEPEFIEVVEKAKLAAEVYWLELGRKNLCNKKFNFTLWGYVMKNRYGWRG